MMTKYYFSMSKKRIGFYLQIIPAKYLRSWQIELPLMHLCQIIQGEKNMGEHEESTNTLQPPLSQQTVLRNEYILSARKSS